MAEEKKQENTQAVAAAPLKEEVADIANRFMRNMTSNIQEEHRAFIQEVTEAITEPKKQIPEPVFKTIFLPYFTGERVPDRENDVIAHWMGIVGSASEPVDIIGPQGDVLFEVPPMVDTERLDTISRSNDGLSLSQVFKLYSDEMMLHETLGNNFLAEKLAEKTSVSLNGPNSSAPKHSWEPALKYYGLMPSDKGGVKVNTSSASEISDDDLEF